MAESEIVSNVFKESNKESLFKVGVTREFVVMGFKQPVQDVFLNPDQALNLANLLVNYAHYIKTEDH